MAGLLCVGDFKETLSHSRTEWTVLMGLKGYDITTGIIPPHHATPERHRIHCALPGGDIATTLNLPCKKGCILRSPLRSPPKYNAYPVLLKLLSGRDSV